MKSSKLNTLQTNYSYKAETSILSSSSKKFEILHLTKKDDSHSNTNSTHDDANSSKLFICPFIGCNKSYSSKSRQLIHYRTHVLNILFRLVKSLTNALNVIKALTKRGI
jgi:hypothetical protein